MKAHLQKIAALAADHAPDALFAVGGGCVAYGVWMISKPAGWIFAGLCLIAAGVVLARGAKK
jgi:hypothetical protein